MLPEERLEEAIKQIELARESDTPTQSEQRRLAETVGRLEGVRAALSEARAADEDAEVIE